MVDLLMYGALALVGVFVIVTGLSCIKIVDQSSVALVERLGKFHKQLEPGLHFIAPFIDTVKYRVDKRIQQLNCPPQAVITKDNVSMTIDAYVFFQITDPFKSVYEISAYKPAVAALTATTLRNEVGFMDLDETLSARDQINTKLRSSLDEATNKWGLRIERVEVQNIDPPQDIKVAMEKQMRAEREKREKILNAEADKISSITESEGKKQSQILQAEGEMEAAILAAKADAESQMKRAEGQAKAIELVAEANAKQINMIFKAMKDAQIDDKMLALKSIEAFEKVATSDNKMLVPYEASALMGSVAAIKDALMAKKD